MDQTESPLQLSDFDPADIKIIPQGVAPSPSPTLPLSLDDVDPHEVIPVADNLAQYQHGSASQQALAGLEGVARGASLGTSDYLEQKLLGANPQDIRGREEANPWSAGIGNAIGGGALLAGTGGFGLGPGIAAAAGQGAIFGAGNVISDAALGDPNLNAQKILAQVGLGAALGGGIGAISKGIGLAKALIHPEAAEGVAEAAIPAAAEASELSPLDEMKSAVANAREYGGQPDLLNLPEKQVVSDAASRMNDKMGQFGVRDFQLGSLDSPDARKAYLIEAQRSGKNGAIIRNFEAAQKDAAINVIDNTIEKGIAPGYTPTTDAQEAGERAADAFTDVIEGTRKELGPAFEKIKGTSLDQTNHLPGVLDYLTKDEFSDYANPNIAKMFETGGDEIAIKPYKTSMGIDKSTYSAIKGAVDSLEENPKDFSQLFDIRKGLNQHVDVTKLGDAPREIASAKAAMMDYIQDAVQKQEPDLAVRDTFKKWAVNEQNAQMIERKFGAEIGSGNFRSLAKGKPDEKILAKIFSDSETVNAAKQILSPDKFNELLADHMAILRNEATSADGVFSSRNFTGAIRKNQYALNEAFGQNGVPLQDIKDAASISRIFPDKVPGNPPNTADTLLQGIANIFKDPKNVLIPHNLIYEGAGLLKDKIQEALETRALNVKLAGTARTSANLNAVQGILQKVTNQINSGAKSLFSTDAPKGALLAAGSRITDAEYDKLTKRLGMFSANPQMMMDHVADNTQHMYQAAPNITQGLSTSLFTGISFLNSKLPQPPQGSEMPLSPKWEPSKAQMNQFNQYYQGVNNPLGVFKQVKSSTLSNNTMEALQTVHPQLLQEMRSKTMEHMNVDKARKLPYAQKLTLSKFLGTPLDENMTGLAITNNQLAMSSPNQSQQTPQAQAAKSTLGGLKRLNVSGRSQTNTHRDLDEK